MFDIGLQEMLVIGVLALLVFGPSKLPELGRMVGRAMREFRRASDEFRSTVETNLHINDIDPPPPAPTYTATATPEASTAVSEAPPSLEAAPVESAALHGGEAADSGDPLFAQRGARLFHRRDCAWARRIPAAARVPFQKIAEARDQGFVTCPVCEPWEPA